MPAPTQDEVRKAVTTALEQARTPLLAALGAGDLAAEAVSGVLLSRVREILQGIAEDERRHGVYLSALRSHLPSPNEPRQARGAVSFLRKLATSEITTRLVRISALDSGVCRVLAEVCRPGLPIARTPLLAALFGQIRRDEGHHVRLSRYCAVMLGVTPSAERAEREWVLREFSALLEPSSAAFEALGVDTRQLLARMGRASPTPRSEFGCTQ